MKEKEIGGYFELELPKAIDHFIHPECAMINSGRNALEYILISIDHKINKIWVPYYTCDVVLQTILKLNIDYQFYHVDINFEINERIELKDNEYIIVNNYFGIKDRYILKTAGLYGEKLIVDNSQAWYAPVIPGIKTFYSPRKFFGLPDGGCAYTPIPVNETLDKDVSYDRCSHLLKRMDINAEAGYDDFHRNSEILKREPLKRMSDLSERILSSIDFDYVKMRRLANYRILEDNLYESNKLNLSDYGGFECPMVYPYLTTDENLRKYLIKNKIFVATYWPNVMSWCKENSIEFSLAKYLIPLPVDQRYDDGDMEQIIRTIKDGSKD